MKWYHLLLAVLLLSCAGTTRDCSSGCAEELGADWLVVQYGYNGTPIMCWKLENTAITNEKASDGIFWQDSNTNNLIHISGWYNRVQVKNSDWNHAANNLNIKLDSCKSGAYFLNKDN